MPAALIYIHGFNSSPASFKARVLQGALAQRAPAMQFIAPALPHSPQAAAGVLDDLVAAHPDALLVGSSLGGYYATWLAERHNLRAVLVNPAVRPYELLEGHVGQQKNLYTGEEYEFTHAHVGELRALECAAVTPQRYLLMVETGDEVLDYRQAVERYRGARQLVIEGGDHGFGDFEKYLDVVFEFCRLA
ncbi:MAG: esterase [Betaproteobacteria bacterium]|nr:esterase [Betaproteobacteria bacterium]